LFLSTLLNVLRTPLSITCWLGRIVTWLIGILLPKVLLKSILM
jgi:hypothetical protein